MSLDRLQSKPGTFTITPKPTPTNNYPGGVAIGGQAGFVEGAAANMGGALFQTPTVTSGASTSIADSGTISHNGCGVAIVAASSAANKTGVIVQAGTKHGQKLTIINTTAANTLTMAAAGTSNVANGTGCIISALAAVSLTWNALDSRWYQVRAA
ncbi:hypothetical protein [uncultured Flavobacterium sp.]|mgnify:FL=1|uniref:hypothetical protein n=1 Tax=uncultured Flavobacterium sp. TaxID=165435 RepID=UPI00259765A5|nr:hypothetical protein [uncultured Flavobacterium sp.]